MAEGQTAILCIVRAATGHATVFCTKLISLAIFDTFSVETAVSVFGTLFTPAFAGNAFAICAGIRSLTLGAIRVLAFLFGALAVCIPWLAAWANIRLALAGSCATFEASRTLAGICALYASSINTLLGFLCGTVALAYTVATVCVRLATSCWLF